MPDLSPEEMAFLEQESARVNAAQEKWYETYGFRHECSCAQDIAEGNTEVAPACWVGMAQDALHQCELQQGALRGIASGTMPDPVTYAQEFTTGRAE